MKRIIVFLIDGLGMGGAERMMIPILLHLSREDFESRVCVLQEKGGNPIADDLRGMGIPVDWLPVRHLRDLTAVPRISRYLREWGADLVHTQLEFSNVLGNISARLIHLPSVCTIHVLPSSELDFKRDLHDRLEAFVLRRFCDRIIAVSEAAGRTHLAANGASPGRVITIYNGIDLGKFSSLDRPAERLSARREFGIAEDAKVLTTVAVLRPEKGIEYMLRALPSVLEAHPEVIYLIVGDGVHRDALFAEAGDDRLRGHVIFAGMRTDVPRLLAASDLFVLPTLTEALPTVLAEAMAARLPIVASAVGGVPEMVVDGRNGRLVEPCDSRVLALACNDLLSDEASFAAMGESSWEIVNQKFSIQRQVDQLKQLYLELIDRYEG